MSTVVNRSGWWSWWSGDYLNSTDRERPERNNRNKARQASIVGKIKGRSPEGAVVLERGGGGISGLITEGSLGCCHGFYFQKSGKELRRSSQLTFDE
ncbi:unnamed protein product [Rhizophagus irregularis]|nr:unnamed protein product [Rhizophagus irregularis]